MKLTEEVVDRMLKENEGLRINVNYTGVETTRKVCYEVKDGELYEWQDGDVAHKVALDLIEKRRFLTRHVL